MIPFLTSTWLRLAAVVGVLAAIAFAFWRVSAWHDSHERLPEIEARLAAEVACTLDSECHQRAATLAEQARLEAAAAAQEALQAAEQAEAKARADAAAWRKRYEAAKVNNPECREWSEQRISCPL